MSVTSDPVAYVVARLEGQYPVGVPYERVVQMVSVELCMDRSEAVGEVESLVEAGTIEKVSADRLTTG